MDYSSFGTIRKKFKGFDGLKTDMPKAAGGENSETEPPEPDYLESFVMFACSNLDEFNYNATEGKPVDWRIKESIMYAIGAIKDQIMDFPRLANQMEDFLQNYVLPEVGSD